jgi:hypothetical protein
MKSYIIVNPLGDGLARIYPKCIAWSNLPKSFIVFDSLREAQAVFFRWGLTPDMARIVPVVDKGRKVPEGTGEILVTPGWFDQAKAVKAWCNWYSRKLDRIINGFNGEGYSGYEQDLFEAFGCQIFKD